jgi:RNA polymerase sigma factor (sigma-70 family)
MPRRLRDREEPLDDSTVSLPDAAMSVEAFSTLVERHTSPLWTFLRQLTRSPEQARDLVQDTFYDAWRAVKRSMRPFTTAGAADEQQCWLYHTAYCRALSVRRRQRLIRWDSLDADTLLESDRLTAFPGFEDAIVESEAMHTALERLSTEDVACLLLIVVYGFTAAETAAILGASVPAVAKRLPRAKRRLLAVYLAEEAHSQEGISR